MLFRRGQTKPGIYTIRSLLLFLVVGPMLIAALLVGLVNWWNSQAAITQTIDRLFVETSRTVAERVSSLLSSAVMIDDVNYHALLSGDLDPEDLRGMEVHLLALLRSNPAVSSVYIGSAKGGLVDAGREGPGGKEYLIETPSFAAGTFTKYAIDERGQKTSIMQSLPSFDARVRPWYTQAVARQGLAWTGIFPLFTGQDSTISAARPVYAKDGKLMAVVSVDLSLSQIARFVREISSAENGLSYIVNRDGLLVASPADPNIFAQRQGNGLARRLFATESADPRIAASASAIRAAEGAGSTSKPYVWYKVGKEGFLSLSAPLADPAGRDWRIVTIYPQAQLLGSIDRLLSVSAFSMFLGILLLVILSFIVTGYLDGKVKAFSAFAEAVAQGRRDESAELAPSSIREIEALRLDLVGMREKLRSDFDELREEVERRKKSEMALEESQRAYDRLAANIPVGVYRATSDKFGRSRYDYLSDRYLNIYGFDAGSAPGDNEREIAMIHPDDRASFLAELARADSSATPFLWEGRILVKGQLRRIRKESIPQVEADGSIHWDGMLTDITESWQASERIRSLLSEKELLLQEVHHRIKNNMGSMMSLLSLQAQSTEVPTVRAALRDAESRLGSMMLLYNKLYRAESVTSMDAAVYLADIADSIASQQGRSEGGGEGLHGAKGPIRIVKKLQSRVLDASILMPMGIVANELITNAYKHAFPDGREGRIVVEFSALRGEAHLSIADDGKGLDGQGESQGFGHAVVEGLTRQLKGRLDVVSEKGTRFELVFPLGD